MKQLFSMLTLILLTHFNPAAEQTSGVTQVRDTVNGSVIFTLNDSTVVETAVDSNGWQRIGVWVALNSEGIRSESISSGSDLTATSGHHIIGHTEKPFKVIFPNQGSGLIMGYVPTAQINPVSVPENRLIHEISQGHQTQTRLLPFMTWLGFREYTIRKIPGYHSYYINQSTVTDPSPRDRISLLFDDAGNLAAVIHSRPLSLPGAKTYDLIRGHSLSIITDLNEASI